MKKIFKLLTFSLSILLALLFLYALSVQECYVKGQSFDSVKYYIVGGCIVEHDGKMIPLENIRGFE